MITFYKLMHRSVKCGVLAIDSENGALTDYRSLSESYAPFLGKADTRRMKRWWTARAVPASRKVMSEIILRSGCVSSQDYLAKNLALSLSDTYWICPLDMDLLWEDVNLYSFSNHSGNILPYHNDSSYDPNASLGGNMEKYWDMRFQPPVLVKTAYRAHGQQAINEAFASFLHRLQGSSIPYVSYTIRKQEDGGIVSSCPAFTSEQTEFVPAMEILDSEKIANDLALYDAYIAICAKNGIDEGFIRDCLDYQTLTDFIISNTDEHLQNFGILRDTNNLRFIGPAPLFDSGNSMFFDDNRSIPYTRAEILERKITGFHEKEEAMLRHVKNRHIVREDRLPDPSAVLDFYATHGIPQERAQFIAACYEIKRSMLLDFQRGKTISFYRERNREEDS